MPGENPDHISFVRLARVLAGATPFKHGNVSDTYRGQVLTSENETRTAILKDVPPKELANEVFVASLARLIGLPVPEPYLALAKPDILATSRGPALEDGSRLVFASVDVAQPQVAMLYLGQGTQQVRSRIAEWASIGTLYGFDTLVANVDRHEGNLLFSGDKEVWLIDHGHCFGGPSWQTASLIPNQFYPNKLSEWLTPAMTSARRAAVAGQAADLPNLFEGADFGQVAAANHVSSLLSETDFSAVMKFLHERLAHVPQQAAAALGINLMV